MSGPEQDTSEPICCPRCGHTVPAAEDCAHCGVVFAKYRPRPEDRSFTASSVAGRPSPARPSSLREMRPLLLALVAAVALFVYWAQRIGDEQAAADRRGAGSARAAELVAPTAAAVPGPAGAERTESPGDGSARRSAPYSPGWYEGADGYREGAEEATSLGIGMAVYFYTDWCPYCREFESTLLYTPEVEEFMENLVSVRINPEDGDAEQNIARRYHVTGYPAFFVHPPGLRTPARISRMVQREGESELAAPEQFIAKLQSFQPDPSLFGVRPVIGVRRR